MKTVEFVGPDGGHFFEDDDLDHVHTVRRWVDCDGVEHSKQLCTPFTTFVTWHHRAADVIAEMTERRATTVVDMKKRAG